jgi:hypothetical protein
MKISVSVCLSVSVLAKYLKHNKSTTITIALQTRNSIHFNGGQSWGSRCRLKAVPNEKACTSRRKKKAVYKVAFRNRIFS